MTRPAGLAPHRHSSLALRLDLRSHAVETLTLMILVSLLWGLILFSALGG